MILWLAACANGTFVERQQALCHPEAGCVERYFFRDADLDGWGDPETSQVFDWPDEGWVDNARDCDDADPEVGARIGAGCPTGTWATDGQVEWLFADGMVDLYQARDTCGPAGFGGELGGTLTLLEYAPIGWEGWLAEGVTQLHPSWGPLAGDLPTDRPVLGGAGALATATADTEASFVCSRPLPDPADHHSLVLP